MYCNIGISIAGRCQMCVISGHAWLTSGKLRLQRYRGVVQRNPGKNWKMVLLERIELSTSPLPRECSTSELQQRCGRVIRLKRNGAQGSLDGFFRLL